MSDADLIAELDKWRADIDSVPFAHEDNAAAVLAVWDRGRAS